MRRSKESQKAHLLNELSSSGGNNKKVIATRGTKVLVGDYKKTENKGSYIPILSLSIAWIVISIFLWFVFLTSISSLVAICAGGLLLIAVLKKFFIKEDTYQLINKIEKKQELPETIDEFKHLFNEEIKDAVEDTSQNISYLEKFFGQNLLSAEDEHYVSKCKEKHLIDLFNNLKESHNEHLSKNQKDVLVQVNALNGKLKNIIMNVQANIEVKIKVKSAFTKDSY